MSQFGSTTVRMRAVTSALTLCAVLALLSSGCVAPGYNAEKEVLFEERILVEPRFGVFIPAEGDFDSAPVIGARLSYEYDYGSYFNFEVSGTGEVEQTAALTPATGGFNGDLRVQDHRALSNVERRSFVASLDWDYRLTQNESMPYLRWGLGLGILHNVVGAAPEIKAVPPIANFSETYRAKNATMILVRPSVGTYWDATENLSLFVDAQYDYARSKVEFKGAVSNDNPKTGVIDFSGINIMFGLTYSF